MASFKEKVASVAVEQAVKYARKDFKRNAPRILNLVEKFDVKKVNRSTYAGLHKVMDDPNNNWMKFAEDLICNMDEHVLTKLVPPLMNVAINSYTREWQLLKSMAVTFLGLFLWTRLPLVTLNAQAVGQQNTAIQAHFLMMTLQGLSKKVKSLVLICTFTQAVSLQ